MIILISAEEVLHGHSFLRYNMFCYDCVVAALFMKLTCLIIRYVMIYQAGNIGAIIVPMFFIPLMERFSWKVIIIITMTGIMPHLDGAVMGVCTIIHNNHIISSNVGMLIL